MYFSIPKWQFIIINYSKLFWAIYYNFSSENNFRKFLGQMNGNFWRAIYISVYPCDQWDVLTQIRHAGYYLISL